MSEQPLRAAVYLRISLDRENTRLGIDRHLEDAEKRIAERGWQQVDLYEDNDMPGTGRKKRPSFERMLADIAQGKLDVIVAQEWPRLERNRAEGARLMELCQERRVSISLVKGMDIDMATSGGRIVADLMSSLARNEIEAKSERQSSAQVQRAKLGRAPKGMRPLGYAINGDVIDDEAAAVKAIYAAFQKGSSLVGIAKALSGLSGEKIPVSVPSRIRHTRVITIERNAKRIETNLSLPAGQQQLEMRDVPDDAPWPTSTVLGILRNPRYAGYSTYTPKTVDPEHKDLGRRRSWRASTLRDDAGEPIRGMWTPIVDEGTWWAVQDRLDDPARITNRSGTERRHLGSGLYLCGVCDKPVRGHTRAYMCAGHIVRGRGPIDAKVLDEVRDLLGSPDLADLLPNRDEPRLKEIKEAVGRERAKISRAQRDYDAELTEARDLKRIRDAAEGVIQTLDAERLRLTASTATGAALGAEDPVEAFETADLATKRGVIDTLFEVRLFPQPQGRKGFDDATVVISQR